MVESNLRLLVALKKRQMTQKVFAELVGHHRSVVSRVVSGVYNLDDQQEERYARVLGMKREELFNNPNEGGISSCPNL